MCGCNRHQHRAPLLFIAFSLLLEGLHFRASSMEMGAAYLHNGQQSTELTGAHEALRPPPFSNNSKVFIISEAFSHFCSNVK